MNSKNVCVCVWGGGGSKYLLLENLFNVFYTMHRYLWLNNVFKMQKH